MTGGVPARWLVCLGLMGCATGALPDHDHELGDAGTEPTADAAATTADGAAMTAAPAGFADPSGTGDTVVLGAPALNRSSGFFTALGSNGRACVTCHDEASGWTVTPAALQARFDASAGTDPIFRLIDGATSPAADVSTLDAARAAYAMLLTKGLIRVGLPLPAGGELALDAVDDPYGFASAAELSLFRRPLPTTNLRFVGEIMWDGREPDLAQQATDATLGHAQAASVDPAQMAAIAALEATLYTAQVTDLGAGALPGGPAALAAQAFSPGINDAATGAFDRDAFALFTAWLGQPGAAGSIAHGEQLFDTMPIQITGVAGIADGPGTCSTCHDTPNVGNHSVALELDTGLADAAARTPDLPLYTLRNTTTGATVQTTDPGRALITGAWADIGKFKVPVLRGLAMRAPYFHNGSAPTIDAVLTFYDNRFALQLSPGDRADLAAFLSAL
jgi:cytochrome c peroxidase